MLLVIRRPGYAGNDSENRAESIVCAVYRVGNPTAAAPMPAFTFEDFVQCGARTDWWRHRAQRARMRFFLERTFPQKFLNILLASERALGLIVKFRFLLFFRGFHATNGNLWSGDLVPPAI